jgi:iron complex outermembrane receptor protein
MNVLCPQHRSVRPIRHAAVQTPPFALIQTTAAVRAALLFTITLGVVAVTTATAQAQTAVESGATTLSPVTVAGDRETVQAYSGGQVATGGRMGLLGDKDFMETPFSTISYTEQYIEDLQARDISEVIAKTDPSVYKSGIPGESQESYSIRGFSSTAADVTMNGLAGMASYYRNSPEMFERIDVLKGPSAMLNGMPPKGTTGGAINLVTKRAADEPLTRVSANYMSDSHFGGHIDMGRRYGEDKQFGIRFNGAYRDGETALKNQDKKVTLAALGLDWRGENVRISADMYHSQDRAYGLTRGLTLAPGVAVPKLPKSNVSWNPPWAYYDSTDKGVMVRGEVDLTEQLMVYAAAGINKSEIDTNMGVGNVLNSAGDFSINYSGVSDRIERKSAEVGVQGKVQTGPVGHQFGINATYYHEDYLLRGFRNLLPKAWVTNIYNPVWGPEAYRPDTIPALTKTKTRLSSVGVADTLSFAQDRLQLTLGVRRQEVISDTYNGTTGVRTGDRYKESATTPAFAMLVKATDYVSLYGNYSEGLSQGAIAPNTASNAGESFAPYKTKQKEVGIKLDLGEFTHTLSLYEIKRPSSYTDPRSNIFSFGGEQRNRGVEWAFFGTAMQGVRLMGGVAYSDAEVTKAAVASSQGKQATGLPKWQAKLGAEWDVPVAQGLTLLANATSVSKQYLSADNSLSIPGNTVFDVGARYATKFAGNPLTLRAMVTNVTGKTYWAKPHYTSLALGAPRTFYLSATMDF